MRNPYQRLQTSGWPELADLGWQRLQNDPHGDLSRWLDAIDSLPVGESWAELNNETPALGRPVDDPQEMAKLLMKLHPWRKGPVVLGGVGVDTEWRSDWKWNRIAPHLELEGQRVLDIGCGNGYFGLRMLGAGAAVVIGIDPTLVFVMQWLAMHKLGPDLNNYVLPLGIEDLPTSTGGFDCVFSMGVLYHRKNPVEHLEQLRALTRTGGQIVLETLVLEGEDERILEPTGRYARMRNVHAIPTLTKLQYWLEQAGLPAGKVLDVTKTTTREQRSTGWMTFESLRGGLDKEDPSLTVEGHPAPVRAALLTQV